MSEISTAAPAEIPPAAAIMPKVKDTAKYPSPIGTPSCSPRLNAALFMIFLSRCSRQEEDKELRCGELILSVGKHQVCWKGQKIDLTRKEFELLQYLMENKGLVMTRNQILCHVWGYDFDGETRTVDVHVRTLRQKLGDAGNQIETVRGVGYRIGA